MPINQNGVGSSNARPRPFFTTLVAAEGPALDVLLGEFFGAEGHVILHAGRPAEAEAILAWTHGTGVDVAIEAVGLPTTLELCGQIVAVGGHIANIGVHGKPVTLPMEKLWERNITLSTRLVDTVTIPVLLKMLQAGRLDPRKLSRHRFPLADILHAYEVFGQATKEKALKVILKGA